MFVFYALFLTYYVCTLTILKMFHSVPLNKKHNSREVALSQQKIRKIPQLLTKPDNNYHSYLLLLQF